jgi:cytochrome c553
MRKISITLCLLVAALAFQFCSHSKKIAASPVTFQSKIQPVIQASCAPCHIAGQGNKKSLDNYLAAKDNIDEILTRIQKNPTDHGFMPMRNAKLSDATIAEFANWKAQGFPEN